jgi:hypothetical protein
MCSTVSGWIKQSGYIELLWCTFKWISVEMRPSNWRLHADCTEKMPLLVQFEVKEYLLSSQRSVNWTIPSAGIIRLKCQHHLKTVRASLTISALLVQIAHSSGKDTHDDLSNSQASCQKLAVAPSPSEIETEASIFEAIWWILRCDVVNLEEIRNFNIQTHAKRDCLHEGTKVSRHHAQPMSFHPIHLLYLSN